MDNDEVVNLRIDTTEWDELLEAALYSVETGILSEEEAISTLTAFLRVIVD